LTQLFGILISIFFAFNGAMYNVAITYLSELYPTLIRSRALGFIFSIGKFASILSQLVFFNFASNQSLLFVPYYISIGFLIITLILVLFLPYETYNKSLDADLSKIDGEEIRKNENDEETQNFVNKAWVHQKYCK